MNLLILMGVIWYALSIQHQKALQIFRAAINRDCAPWDGGAFTTLIPMNDGTTLHISIWQSPDIKLPVTFSCPDETGQIGFAYILPETDTLQELTGEISFARVEVGSPVEGQFNFANENGKQFKGKFIAEWGNEIVYCG